MKSEKRQRQNPSSKVLMGLAAVGATGSASGALVQIDLIGNTITAGGGNQLNADFTGDGVTDVTLSSSTYFSSIVVSGRVRVNVALAAASSFSTTLLILARALGPGTYNASPGGSAAGTILFSFDGSSLGLNANVTGLLSLVAGGLGPSRGVTLESLVFDDGTGTPVTATTDISGARVIGETTNGIYVGETVPEPSSLALLALGAAGVITRRQRKKAA